MKFSNTMTGIVNFREAVKNFAFETARYAECDELTDELLEYYRDEYFADMEFDDPNDYEEVVFQFDIAFKQGWKMAREEL